MAHNHYARQRGDVSSYLIKSIYSPYGGKFPRSRWRVAGWTSRSVTVTYVYLFRLFDVFSYKHTYTLRSKLGIACISRFMQPFLHKIFVAIDGSNALYKQAGVILPEAGDEEAGGCMRSIWQGYGAAGRDVEGVRGRKGNTIRRERPSFRPYSR